MTADTVEVAFDSPKHSHFDELVGSSRALRRILSDLDMVAPTGATVLIHGETGTGKELIARAIHNLSPRWEKSFVKFNCAAIPTGLLESELFGHERGAFTGALAQRLGRFEVADGGTIFLDEVGEIPLELQTKLLRVLQEKEFERLGSTRTIRVDTRVVAATNRDLTDMAAQGKFRSDLFYRLNVFPVRIPALRERAEDIPLLARLFLSRCNRKMGKAIDTILPETMTAMTAYSWPGNIRELENLIERAAIRTRGTVLDLPLRELQNRPLPSTPKKKAQNLEQAERAHILAALQQTKWVIAGPNGAATLLGINRSTLQHRMERLGIVKPRK
jgi:formate hydrogenlyase transcriptional activator